MQTRLLSFFSEFERALAIDDPAPDDGAWHAERRVNYSIGLGRLALYVKHPDGVCRLRGTVLAQCFRLADNTPCLKAQYAWAGTEATAVHAIYDKPGCDWSRETRRLAAEWMAGPPAPLPAIEDIREPLEALAAAAV